MTRSFHSARLLAAAFVALAASSLGAQSAPPPSPTTLTPHQKAARAIYKQLIEINTVDSVGSVTKAAEAIAARFRAAGFPAKDVQVLVPAGHPTKGNLVVRYRGRAGASAKKPILLLAHLDVVAANRDDWPRDPFVLHEEGGYFLGRGTSDDKAMAAIFVANLLQMKQQGIVPDRDIILALTADEENGDSNGAEWLANTHKPLIDAAYAINEEVAARSPRGSRSTRASRRRRRCTSTSPSPRRTPAGTRACRVRTTPSTSWRRRCCASRSTSSPSR
jgi:acetylornithine deacetylase/succinyl-diaminopimelate desuccinylase-like protein